MTEAENYFNQVLEDIDEIQIEEMGIKLGDSSPTLQEVEGVPNPNCEEFGHDLKSWEFREPVMVTIEKFLPGRIIVRGGVCKKCNYSFTETFCG